MSLWPVNNQKMWERLFLPVASCVHVNWLSVLFRQTLGIALKSVDSAIDGLSDEQFQMFLSLLCSSDHTWHSGSVIWWTACKDTYTRWFRGFYYVYVISYCNNVKLVAFLVAMLMIASFGKGFSFQPSYVYICYIHVDSSNTRNRLEVSRLGYRRVVWRRNSDVFVFAPLIRPHWALWSAMIV